MSTPKFIAALAQKVYETLPDILSQIETDEGLDDGYIKRLTKFTTYDPMSQSWPNGYAIVVNEDFQAETIRYPKTVDTVALIFRITGVSNDYGREWLYYYRDAIYTMVNEWAATRVNFGLCDYGVIGIEIRSVALRENTENNNIPMRVLGIELEITRQG